MHTDLDRQRRVGISRLRQLPDEMLPPYNWQEFHRRSQQRVPGARDRLEWSRAAVAAALVVVVGGLAVWFSIGKSVSVTASAVRQLDPIVVEDVPARNAQFAVDRSQVIETWLASLPQEPVVVRVGTRAAVAGLEDRIAQVDDLLTSVRLEGTRLDHLAALQQERVRLVGSLAQVRYAEVVASESP